jgi:glycosyltransferase involved in cell wall biosynthesis
MSFLSSFNFHFLKRPATVQPFASLAPKISVVVPSYNQAQFLERTLLSVINQGYANYELIVIDGGSNDHSVQIIKQYEKYISYWVSEPDKGQSHAINKGFAKATGHLLCFQNSDDLFYEGAFGTLAAFYQKHPNYNCYYGNMLIINAQEKVLEALKTVPFNLKAQVVEGMQVFNQSCFVTKDTLQQWGGVAEHLQFVIDYENILRWASNGATFAKVPKLWGAFRLHEDAKTAKLEPVRAAEHQRISEEYRLKMGYNTNSSVFIYKIYKLLYFIYSFDWPYLAYKFGRTKSISNKFLL